MKLVLLVALLSSASWAQNGGVIPPPDIVGAVRDASEAPIRAESQAAQIALIKQQTALLKQQTEALKQQNALLAAQAQKQFVPLVRKPRIDDIDAATGKPQFTTWADYEDAKDEWLIEEVLRRVEASRAAAPSK